MGLNWERFGPEFGIPLLSQRAIVMVEGVQKMLKTLLSEERRRKLKTSTEDEGKKLGKCVLCGERVKTDQRYLTTSEGYTHKACLKEWRTD